MAMEETQTRLLEVMQTEILARLPLKTIFRFKSVSKKWKSTLESPYFRRLFLSLHRASWSLLHGADELIGFHGCKTWDLPKSPASLIPYSFKRYLCGDCDYVDVDSSGGLVLLTDGADKSYCYVGNPVSQHVKIPPPPSDPTGDNTYVFGLVTRLDEDGVVLSFKVVRLASYQTTNDHLSSDMGTVYLWSQRDYHWVSCYLRKQDYTILGHQDCFIDESVCKKSVDEIWDPRALSDLDEEDLSFRVCIWFCPFVIPRWMAPVPRPPQTEMIDTNSLLSYATATHEAKMEDIRNDEYFWMEVEQGRI